MTQLSTEVLIPRRVQIRYTRALFSSMIHISSSDTAVTTMNQIIEEEQIDHKEYFWVILLNCANRVLGMSRIAEGSERGVVVSVREILQFAILSHAGGVIVMHNHPSGNREPSHSDRVLTNELSQGLRLFDITLLDHIIFTSESHFSMADEGLLP